MAVDLEATCLSEDPEFRIIELVETEQLARIINDLAARVARLENPARIARPPDTELVQGLIGAIGDDGAGPTSVVYAGAGPGAGAPTRFAGTPSPRCGPSSRPRSTWSARSSVRNRRDHGHAEPIASRARRVPGAVPSAGHRRRRSCRRWRLRHGCGRRARSGRHGPGS